MLRVALALASLAGTAHAQALTPDDLRRKSEGHDVTGTPLASYSVDFGYGGGARAYYYWNGDRDDPLFARTPYLHRVFVQAYATTAGLSYHWADYDAPRFLGSAYRPRLQLAWAHNTAANYFGGQRALRFPGSPETFDDYADYGEARERVVDGMTYARYDQVDISRPLANLSVERAFANNQVRVLAGLGLAYATIEDYSGTQVDGATQAPTRFREDCDAGRIVGCTGGRDHYLRIGIAYDTRDYEPDPNSGIFADAELNLGTSALGSQYDYVRGMIAVRGFYSPIPDRADLVLAARVLALAQTDGTPFFTLGLIPFTEDPRYGLGGHRTMRGFRQDRFVDHAMAAASFEVRWTFARTRILKQKLAFIAAPFVDTGRAFDDLGAFTLRGWRPSTGAALRVSWNLATLVTFDYGVSAEDAGFYVNFGHMF